MAALALVGVPALAQDLSYQRDTKQAELEDVREKGEVLSTEISAYSDEIDQLAGEVATLRSREAIVAEELVATETQLDTEKARLEELRERLGRSLKVLSKRLVEIYKSDQPDALTVIFDSDGFDDLVNRYDYLDRIQDQDAGIVNRVRDIRDETEGLVGDIRNARDEIAAKKVELERTRIQLESREAELDAVRDQKAAALDVTQTREERLEGDISDLNARIQDQLAAAQSSTSTTDPLPAGPIQGGSGDMIWPVNGPVTSPFGMRWGRLHAGIDIGVPAGTPIRAVKDGNIVLVESEAESGGYGNYTCIDHGGGLSSCYAHQSSFEITSGSVSQGDVIGYIGCTGNCFGDHLHFEIRINGVPTDPLGYL
ncbi:MAG: peptidoglycan DD-metalloendopeptidase family protein [Actinomycetota bacterium]|nr:peptidoglycan DD-metalloendopeptidase family protein [Actinomycetota bacterium]